MGGMVNSYSNLRGISTKISEKQQINDIIQKIAETTGKTPQDVYIMAEMQSPSMSPLFEVGANVPVKVMPIGAKYKKGDIIAFERDGVIVVHKVEYRFKSDDGKIYYVTGGLNPETNQYVDEALVSQDDIIGKADLSRKGMVKVAKQGQIVYIEAYGMPDININQIKKLTTTNNRLIPIFSSKEISDSNCIGEPTTRWIVCNGKQGKAIMLKKYINAINNDESIINIKDLKDSDIFIAYREKLINEGIGGRTWKKLNEIFSIETGTGGNVASMNIQIEFNDKSAQSAFGIAFSTEEPLPGTTRYEKNKRIIYASKGNKIGEALSTGMYSEFHAERKLLFSLLYKTDWKNVKNIEVIIASERGYCKNCYKLIYEKVFNYLISIGYTGELIIYIRNLEASENDNGVRTNPDYDNPFVDNSERENIFFSYQQYCRDIKLNKN